MGVTIVFDLVITIENVVMIGTFSEGINLDIANQKLEDSKRNWQRFPGLAFKLKTSPATFLLFQSGKFVCTGTKTETKGKQAINQLLNILKTKDLVSNNCVFDCAVKNLVASVDIGGASIALEQFTREFESIYEPDRFPAAVYKSTEQNATFLVFLTGKLICSGIADEETLKQAIKDFYNQLVEKKAIEKILSPLS
jgi:transcription initiation factor TFIID TATA-box-binding protein